VDYDEFIASKSLRVQQSGFDINRDKLHSILFPFQQDTVKWAIKRGKAAIFANTGLGKTLTQLEWSKQIHDYTGGNILILAPLAVASQTAREAEKLGMHIKVCHDQSDVQSGVNITNYEKLHKFDPSQFVGIVLDESGILKSFSSKTRNQIIESFSQTPYKLACTATPAPNDYMELGNHAEFLNVMSRSEMLSMFFVHDGGDTSQWRLKGHAEDKFWEWVASWAVMIRHPSDLGYDDEKFNLPPLNVQDVTIQVEKPSDGHLFAVEAQTLQERRNARRSTIAERARAAHELFSKHPDDKWLIWCDLNDEQDALEKLFKGACVSIRGTTSDDDRVKFEEEWRLGDVPVLITKGSIFGTGMNWQHCHRMIFVGLSDSFEQLYQAIRRCYRFGQDSPVDVYMVTSNLEGAVSTNIKRKEIDFEKMQDAMAQHTKSIVAKNIKSASVEKTDYHKLTDVKIPSWLRGEGA
jgi:superfamily II DNA or RNA helicase